MEDAEERGQLAEQRDALRQRLLLGVVGGRFELLAADKPVDRAAEVEQHADGPAGVEVVVHRFEEAVPLVREVG